MKKFIIIILLMLFLFFSLFSQENIVKIEKEVKSILNKVAPSIVKVVSENHKRYIATGIAIERDLVLTSTLITRHPYEKIFINTYKNKKYYAKIIGRDRDSSIILLKLKEKVLNPITRATKLEVGDWIALVGVFYNSFPSIFQGIVSSASDDELILNAPVTPGAAGGAVVNKRGELVAVVRGRVGFSISRDFSFKDYSTEILLIGERSRDKNLCYAVPIKKVIGITSQLKKYGKVKRGWLGVYFTSNIKDNKVMVTSVMKDSPAKKAGVRKGDVIISIDGNKIKSNQDVIKVVKSISPGKSIKVRVKRGKKMDSLLVKIGELKERDLFKLGDYYIKTPKIPTVYKYLTESIPRAPLIPEIKGGLPKIRSYTFYFRGSKKLGIDVMEITPELANKFKVKQGYGLMISKISKGSSADKAGFKVGDIIVKANDKNIKTTTNIRDLLSSLKGDQALLIELYRDGRLKKFKVTPDKSTSSSFNWDLFKDRMKDFYIRINKRDDSLKDLKKQMERLKDELELRNRMTRKVSKKEAERINARLEAIKVQYKKQYEKEIKRIEAERARLKTESLRTIKELKRLQEHELRRIEEQKRREIEEKKKREKKSNITTV